LIFYKADGKELLALTNWTERARYKSRFPTPSGADARSLGCKIESQDNQSCLTDNQRQQQTSKPNASSLTPSPKPAPKPGKGEGPPKLTEPNAPPVLEPNRADRPNSVELAVALAEFAKINDREKSGDPAFQPWTADEVRQAWNHFEGYKDPETGEWLQPFGNGRRPIGCWKAAMMERMGHNRNNYRGRNGPTEDRGKVGANEIKQTLKIKRV
jgi:hypothetical protein